jgi:hypothetical protein
MVARGGLMLFLMEVDWLTRPIVTRTPKSRMAVRMRRERVFMMLCPFMENLYWMRGCKNNEVRPH